MSTPKKIVAKRANGVSTDKKKVVLALKTRLNYIEKMTDDGHGPRRYSEVLNVLYLIAMGKDTDRDGKILDYPVQYRIKAANAYLARMNDIIGLEKRAGDSDDKPTKIVIEFPAVQDGNQKVEIGIRATSGSSPSIEGDLQRIIEVSDIDLRDQERENSPGDGVSSPVLVNETG